MWVTVFESLEKKRRTEQASGLATSPSSPTTRRRRRTSGATRRSSASARSCASSWRWETRSLPARSVVGQGRQALLDEAEAKVFEIAGSRRAPRQRFRLDPQSSKRVVDPAYGTLRSRPAPPRSPACRRPAWSTSTKTSGLQPSGHDHRRRPSGDGHGTRRAQPCRAHRVEQPAGCDLLDEMPGTQLAFPSSPRWVASTCRRSAVDA